MRRALPLFALVVLLSQPVQAGAEDPTPDNYRTSFGNTVGVISAGTAEWYLSYPTNVPTTGTYHVAVTVSTTAVATANLVLAAGTFQGSGCTVGALVADTGATSQASGYVPVTTTGAYCFGSIRLTLSSVTTTISAIRATFQIASDTVTVSDDADGWDVDAVVSGGLTVTDDANGWSTVNSGTLAVSGGLTVTDDANGWAQTVSGGLTVTDDANGWQVHLCGQTGACGPIQTTANTTVSVTNTNITEAQQMAVTFPGFDGLAFDGAFLLLLWLVAIIWCMRKAKLFSALAATVGVICVLIPGPEYIAWVGVLLFVLVLWLEAIARDKLPYHWFKGSNSTERSV